MVTVGEFGADFQADYNFVDGDLQLIEDKENIVQSIQNRLNCMTDFYSLFYAEYGGYLHNFHGWKRTQETLNFMKVEITKTLQQDPRFTDIQVDLEFGDEGVINMQVLLHYDDDSDLSMSFVISDAGVVSDDEDEDEEE